MKLDIRPSLNVPINRSFSYFFHLTEFKNSIELTPTGRFHVEKYDPIFNKWTYD